MEGGLEQQGDDGGGCATMRESQKRVESPGAYVDDCILRGHFCGVPVSFGPLSCALGTYLHLERGGMPFHDGVGINCKKGAGA